MDKNLKINPVTPSYLEHWVFKEVDVKMTGHNVREATLSFSTLF